MFKLSQIQFQIILELMLFLYGFNSLVNNRGLTIPSIELPNLGFWGGLAVVAAFGLMNLFRLWKAARTIYNIATRFYVKRQAHIHQPFESR